MQPDSKQQLYNKLFHTFLFLYSCKNKYDFYNGIDKNNLFPRTLQPMEEVTDEEFQDFKDRILTELQESISILEDDIAREE